MLPLLFVRLHRRNLSELFIVNYCFGHGVSFAPVHTSNVCAGIPSSSEIRMKPPIVRFARRFFRFHCHALMLRFRLFFFLRRSLHYCSEEDTPKSCCGLLTLPDATSTVSIRWFIGVVFIAGICSALVGTVLGATRASGREHLTVALLMIGKNPENPKNTQSINSVSKTKKNVILSLRKTSLPTIFVLVVPNRRLRWSTSYRPLIRRPYR